MLLPTTNFSLRHEVRRIPHFRSVPCVQGVAVRYCMVSEVGSMEIFDEIIFYTGTEQQPPCSGLTHCGCSTALLISMYLRFALVAVIVVSLGLAACNNAVNDGYRYGYPSALKADTAYAYGGIGVNLRLSATVPDGCWQVDRTQLDWVNDSVANIRVLCRHDLSARCYIKETSLSFDYQVVAPYPHTYIFRLYRDQFDSSYTQFSVVKSE